MTRSVLVPTGMLLKENVPLRPMGFIIAETAFPIDTEKPEWIGVPSVSCSDPLRLAAWETAGMAKPIAAIDPMSQTEIFSFSFMLSV